MDCRGFVEGVTAYLPVFVSGALFHKSAMGTPSREMARLSVQDRNLFRCPVHRQFAKREEINWPMEKNYTFLLTVGNPRPLDGAVQYATTEMIHWLEELGLEGNAAHILLGQLRGIRSWQYF